MGSYWHAPKYENQSDENKGRVCCLLFVNLCNLQNVPCTFEIMHMHYVNFWPKPDPNANPNPDPNPRQIVQHILQIVRNVYRYISNKSQ